MRTQATCPPPRDHRTAPHGTLNAAASAGAMAAMHRAALARSQSRSVPARLLKACEKAWPNAMTHGSVADSPLALDVDDAARLEHGARALPPQRGRKGAAAVHRSDLAVGLHAAGGVDRVACMHACKVDGGRLQ